MFAPSRRFGFQYNLPDFFGGALFDNGANGIKKAIGRDL
jgi:hypothetical protein